VAIDGDYMVVGSPWEPEKYLYGALHIFKFNGTSWELQNSFNLDEQTENDRFGFMVDISGDYAIANAVYWDDTNITDCGAAWVFKRNGDTWEIQQQLLASNREKEDNCTSVVIEGNYAMLGFYAEDTKALHAGAVYVFKKTPFGWEETQKLMASDGVGSAFFGRSMAMDSDYVLIGTDNHDQGKGTEDSRLSDITLLFMMKRAHAQGISFTPEAIVQLNPDIRGTLHETKSDAKLPLEPRKIEVLAQSPDQKEPAPSQFPPKIHHTVFERMEIIDLNYNPVNINQLGGNYMIIDLD